jgi:hypothetical protein
MPYGFKIAFSNFTSDSGLEAQLGHVEPQVFFVEQPQHDLLAPQRGQRADAEIELLLFPPIFIFSMMRPSCGSRFSLMSSFAMILMRDVIASFSFIGGDMIDCSTCRQCGSARGILFRTARCECRWRRASPRRQHQVHQLDDGSFVGGLLQFRQAHFCSSDCSSTSASPISDIDCITASDLLPCWTRRPSRFLP